MYLLKILKSSEQPNLLLRLMKFARNDIHDYFLFSVSILGPCRSESKVKVNATHRMQ